jgi:hypothetical protein
MAILRMNKVIVKFAILNVKNVVNSLGIVQNVQFLLSEKPIFLNVFA